MEDFQPAETSQIVDGRHHSRDTTYNASPAVPIRVICPRSMLQALYARHLFIGNAAQAQYQYSISQVSSTACHISIMDLGQRF